MSATKLKPIRIESYLLTTAYCLAQQRGLVWSRQAGQIPAADCQVQSNVTVEKKKYLIELVRDMPSVWDQKDRKYLKTEISNQDFGMNWERY